MAVYIEYVGYYVELMNLIRYTSNRFRNTLTVTGS